MCIGYLPMSADILHFGHVYAIRKAQSFCDTLIIGIITDKGIKKYKGKLPIVPYNDRKNMLVSVTHSRIVKQKSIDPYENLKKYEIDVIFTGDYWEEEEGLAAKRANVALCSFHRDDKLMSTTNIINKIIEEYEESRTEQT